MGRYLAIAALIVFLLAAGVVGLFVVQNSARTTQLSLDLGVAAWQLKRPMSVPTLLGIAFGAGFVFGAVPMGIRSMASGRKAKRLERQLATSADRTERPW